VSQATPTPTGHRRHDAFGITGAARGWLPDLGEAVAELGYHELWANDTRRGSGLATLAVAAERAPSLELGVGVIGLSERGAERIAAEVAELRLPLDRLVLGVGSGRSRSPLGLVERGVAELREQLPGVRICVAALGPRMLQLAGRVADVVLLNWITPPRILAAREQIASGAHEAGRPMPRVAAYVRVAVGDGAEARLTTEVARYAGAGSWYERAIATQGAGLIGVACELPAEVPAALAAYRVELDTCVVRGLPAGDDLNDWLAIARAAAPQQETAG
jgi:alkanesulfonate monooxygenase SsuD/methylene tetrahydromethanopterin reductase-like flavin-dependent oxidoreductase (luciferase family)